MDAPPSTDKSVFQIKSTLTKPQANNKLDPAAAHQNQDPIQTPQQSCPRNPKSFNLLRLHLKFAYYTCQQPWKPVYNKAKDCWEVTSSKIQKALCCAVLVASLAGVAIAFRDPDLYGTKLSRNSPLQYLKQVWAGLGVVHVLWFPWSMFKSSADLSIILNHVNGNRGLFHSGRVRQYLCIMYIILVCLIFIQGVFVDMMWIDSKNPTFVLSTRGFQLFVYDAQGMPPVDTEEMNLLWNAKNIAWFLIKFILLFLARFQLTLYLLFFVCTLPLTLWGPTAELETSLLRSIDERRCWGSGEEDVSLKDVVMQEYARLKHLSDAVNRSWSTLFLNWIIATSIWTIVKLNGAGQRWGFIGQFVVVVFCALVSLLLFAQVARIMARFRAWLLRLDNAQLFSEGAARLWWEVTLMEVEGGRVGMGEDGMYIVDYGFLAQLAAVSITLVVVSFDK